MRKLALGALLITSMSFGQEKKAAVEKYDFKPLMQQIWAGWETLDPANTAKFYDKAPGRVFFDLAPLKYTGWAQYEAGVKKEFADAASAHFTLNPDARVSQRGNFAWGTATLHATLQMKNGAKEELDIRWTVLWEKKGDDWLIVHEHVSTPPPPPPAPPKAAKKK